MGLTRGRYEAFDDWEAHQAFARGDLHLMRQLAENGNALNVPAPFWEYPRTRTVKGSDA